MKIIVFDAADGAILRSVSCPDADAAKQAKAGEGWITAPPGPPANSETHRVNLTTFTIEEI